MATRTQVTRADIEHVADDANGRHEIIDGELVVSPAPGLRHARALMAIVDVLRAWTRVHGGEVVHGPFELYISEARSLIPDALLMLERHRERLDDRYLRLPPDLVVEVSSSRDSRSRDLGPKRQIYARFGVPEYWVADLDDGAILAFRLDGDRYLDAVRHSPDAVLTTPLLPGFAAPVADLLAHTS